MTFLKGQGVLGKIRFVDGQMPRYDRTYLIVGVYNDHIDVLNVSSIQGKEHKLLFPTNEELKVFEPPFKKPSFVKLDSLVSVNQSDYHNLKILYGGARLNFSELYRICNMLP